jgi:hypothetical protein
MGCLVSNNTDLCNKYQERKCEVHGLKEQEYDFCMLVQYERAGMNLRAFCNKKYNLTNKLWSKAEIASPLFYIQKHECLLNAGVKRGKEYCDDQNVLLTVNTKLDLYKCYA